MEEIKHENIVWLFREAKSEEAEKFLGEHRNWNKVNSKIHYIWKVIDKSLEKLGKTQNDLEKEIYGNKTNKDEHVKKNESEQFKSEAEKIKDENKDEISQAETAVSTDSEENKEIGLSIHGCAYLACKAECIALTQIVALEEKIKDAWKNQSDPLAKEFFKKHFISNQNNINDIVEKNSSLIYFLNPEFRKIVTRNLRLGHSFAAVFTDVIGSVFKLADEKDLKSLDTRIIAELAGNKDAFGFYKEVFAKALKAFPETIQNDAKRFLGVLELLKKNNQSSKNVSDVIKYIFVVGTIGLAVGIPLASIFMIIPTIISGLITAGVFSASKKFGETVKGIENVENPLSKIKQPEHANKKQQNDQLL